MEPRPEVSWPSTLALAARAVLGFAVGFALLLANAWGSKDSSMFLNHGEAWLWIGLVAVQTAFWATVTTYVWKLARHYLPRSRRDLEQMAAPVALLFVLLMVVPPLAASRFSGLVWPLWGELWKIPLFIAAGFSLVFLPSLLGILGIQAFAARNTHASLGDTDIDAFIGLRDDLNRFLGLLGATIGLAVLSSGALRQAVLASIPNAVFPVDRVIGFGTFLTLLLAFAYAPANHTLTRLGLRIRDVLLPDRPSPRDPRFGDWYSTRKNLNELLQLDITTYQRLQTAVLILSPLLTAGLSVAVPSAKK